MDVRHQKWSGITLSYSGDKGPYIGKWLKGNPEKAPEGRASKHYQQAFYINISLSLSLYIYIYIYICTMNLYPIGTTYINVYDFFRLSICVAFNAADPW